MSENSIDDKYKIPQEFILKTRIDDNFSWSNVVGRPIITTLNNIVFHEQTGDSVSGKNHFNLSDAHLELKCTLSDISISSSGIFYIGGWNYYGVIRDSGLSVYGPNGQSAGPFEYNNGTIYTQYYDSTVVQFRINHSLVATFPIQVPINQENPTLECMWYGYDVPNSNSTSTITINNITCYVSGQKGIKGIDGDAVYLESGTPDSTIGESGDFYYNLTANSLYGRKSGLGGSLFFDGVHANNTSLTIPNDEDLRLGTEDFTIEWFQYMTDDSWGHVLSMVNAELSSGMSIAFGQSGPPGTNQILIFFANGNAYPLEFLQYEQRWVHIAVTRSTFLDGHQYLNLHVNGVWQHERIISENIFNTTDPLIIGNISNMTGDFKGYITNLRIIKGKAIYVSVFDIPIQPLLDISGSIITENIPIPTQYATVLLLTADTLNNAFVDTSNKHKIVTNNNVMWDPVTPFKNTGVWNTNPIIVSNTSFPVSISSSLTPLWDFILNGFKSIIIYLNCADGANSYQPQIVSIISVNYSSINGIKYNVVTGLAPGIILSVYNNTLYVSSGIDYDTSRVMVSPIV